MKVFYQSDCITKLKYDSYGPLLKYGLFTRHPNYCKKNLLFSPTKYKNEWKEHNFQWWKDLKKKKKSTFYKNKKLFKIDDIDVDKILISKKDVHGKKSSFIYIIGYNDDDVIRPLCIKLPQMIRFVQKFDDKKIISFKVTDKKLLKRYTKIWGKVSSLINKEFDSEPFYGDNDKYIKTNKDIQR